MCIARCITVKVELFNAARERAGSFGKLPEARIDLHGRRHPGG
jgi:hypothetical protein